MTVAMDKNIAFNPFTSQNYGLFKKLEQVLAPSITRKDAYMKEVLATGDLSTFVLVRDVPVGAVVAFKSNETGDEAVIIKSLYVLPAYASLDLERRLIEYVEKAAKELKVTHLYMDKTAVSVHQVLSQLSLEVKEPVQDKYILLKHL